MKKGLSKLPDAEIEKCEQHKWIVSIIQSYALLPENTLKNQSEEPAWETPVVGFSRGDDPLWEQLKRDIGPFYWTPIEIYRQTFLEDDAEPEDLTVIAWILPQTETTKKESRKRKRFPSERWARSRKFGEEFNVKLREYLVNEFKECGIRAVAPQLSPLWSMEVSEKYGLSSKWSERHAAYVSGLGTFGLCDGLITEVGKAIRCGSVVAKTTLPPTPRPYKSHREYCLFFSKGACSACIKRCPAGAISEKGHDKKKCQEYVDFKTREYINKNYGFDAYGCGLCQVGVPCESKIP